MADGIIRRFVRVIFDRSSAKKAEQELVEGIGSAGKKAGDNFARNLKASFAKEMASLKTQLAKGLIDEKEFKKRADIAARTFNKGIIEGMEKARKAGTLTDKEFVKLSNTLKRTGDQGMTAGQRVNTAFMKLGATLAATFSVQAGIRFFQNSIQAALEAERSVQRLDSALRPLGLTYAQVGKRAEALLDQIQETTRFSDEDAREALTALVTGTGDYNRSLELLEVTAKIAEKRQISMTDAAQVALKASQGLTKGMLDLGIGAGETGDIIGKINKNLGDLAVEGGRTSEGMLKRAANLWDEFQENIGKAVIGSDAFQDSGIGLIETLKSLNKWTIENNKSIGESVSLVANLLANLVKFGLWIVDHTPNIVTFKRHFFGGDDKGAEPGLPTAEPIVVSGPTTPGVRTRGTPTGKPGKKTDADREAEREARRAAHDRESLARDIAIKEIQLNEQVTEAYAAEQVKRQEMLGNKPSFTGSLEEGFARLGQLNLLLAAGLGNDLIPKLADTKGAIGEIVPAVDNLAEAFATAQQKLADDAAYQAEHFKEPWIDAMGIIRNEVEGQGTLFLELGHAWAEGGFAGIASLAAAKVRENAAYVIENIAKALGSLGLGNPAAAGKHFAAAAKHTAAIAAWKVAGAAAGGGGSGGGAGGAGGSGTGNAAARSAVPDTEVHIYLEGHLSALDPKVQKVVHLAAQNARERYGNNVKVHTRRGG
jgi:hypothetical protein